MVISLADAVRDSMVTSVNTNTLFPQLCVVNKTHVKTMENVAQVEMLSAVCVSRVSQANSVRQKHKYKVAVLDIPVTMDPLARRHLKALSAAALLVLLAQTVAGHWTAVSWSLVRMGGPVSQVSMVPMSAAAI